MVTSSYVPLGGGFPLYSVEPIGSCNTLTDRWMAPMTISSHSPRGQCGMKWMDESGGESDRLWTYRDYFPPFSVSLLLPLSHAILPTLVLFLWVRSSLSQGRVRCERGERSLFLRGTWRKRGVGLILSGVREKVWKRALLNVIKWYCSAYKYPCGPSRHAHLTFN